MKKQQIISMMSTVGFTISTVLGGYTLIAQKAMAQELSGENTSVLTAQLSARVGFVPPADDGAPQHTRGGATRDAACDALQVLPEGASGLTASARPMIQAYFQEGVKQVWLKVEAVDGSEKYSYEPDQYFVLPEGKGFSEVPLPESMSELTLDKQYVWSMVFLCDDPLGPSSPVVKGSIRRVAVNVETAELEQMSLLEKANTYGEAGLWYDFAAVLTQMRLASPNDMQVAHDWEAALSAEGLAFIFDD